MESIVIGHLEFVRVGNAMFVNRLVDPNDPDGDGDHIATAECFGMDEVWESFVTAARAGDVRPGSSQ